MAKITSSSGDWTLRRGGVSRGEAAGLLLPGLPDEFLAPGTQKDDEVIVEARAPRRGEPLPSGSLDLTCELGPGEAAVLAVRHASGALTFHLPTETVRPTRGGAGVTRFSVRVPDGGADERATRGVVTRVVKAILVKVTEAAIDKAVGLALPALARAFETATWNQKGLKEGWLEVTADALAAGKLVAGTPASTERSLLLLHGTFSNAAAAFASLAQSDFFTRVSGLYDKRVFAFDHFTLSRTPEENVRMLLEGLPDKRFTFDVVTHSRGGLVLRNLAERASAFGPLANRFQLGRVVLVASPNEGTPLATPRRWEDTVGWVANLLEILPDHPFTTGAAFVANGLVWLARHASGDLPGLAAMDGDGPMIRVLQGPPGPPPESYSALVANYAPSGDLLRRLLDAGLDQFFGSANDLVVPSEGGWRIDRSGSAFVPGARIGCFGPGGNLSGDTVTHVNIFAQADTPGFLARALAGESQPLVPVDPARTLPDRRLLRAGAAGVAAPVLAVGGQPAAAQRDRIAGPRRAGAREAASPAAFQIRVVNGDLSFERRALFVGHYRSAKLTGAEAFIDRAAGGVMTRSLELGVYPAEPGSHRVFMNTFVNAENGWLTPRPSAVVVVGLGQEGALRPVELAQAVRQAVIGWALRQVEGGEATGAGLEIASTLMGSGGAGIAAAQSAVLIAQGVFEANELLRRRAADLPRVRELRLIELYTDRAAEAWRALNMQAEATPGRFTVVGPLQAGTGSLLRPLESSYRGAGYDYIMATTRRESTGETAIEYALDTERARTEVRAQVAQAKLLQNLVIEASSVRDADERIGRMLYQLLVPIELEGFLSTSGETQLVLDEGTAGIPWELLDDGHRSGPEDVPWAVRAKLLRKFKTESYRQRVADPERDAPMLVIGEPACPPEYPPLPGAYEEARAVCTCLQGGGAVGLGKVTAVMAERVNGAKPVARDVIGTLLSENWRVVHVAGHGAIAGDDGAAGGVVLSDGTFLGPAEIDAMRVVPELVFVNCCHLGAIGSTSVLYNRVRFASTVARKLIDIGVRCVVAAGWAVDDLAAEDFATTFYRALLRGNRFVEAIAAARRAAYASEGNTWAAYQCYGDPDWRLVPDGSTNVESASPEEFTQIGSIAGLKLQLRTMIVDSTYRRRDAGVGRKRLSHLEQRWREAKWPTDQGVGELFAEAYAAAGAIDDAIRWYDTAIETTEGRVSVRAYEQRSNLRIRAAWRAVEAARGLPAAAGAGGRRAVRGKAATSDRRQGTTTELRRAADRARRTIELEVRELGQLATLGETAERDSLLGSAMKRLAMVEEVAGRRSAERAAIGAMATHYQRALERLRESESADVFYPAINVIVARLALGEPVPAALFAEARAGLHAKEAEGADFWSVVGETELALYEAMATGQLAKRRKAIIGGYDDLAGRVRGGSQWGSVYDTANFVISRFVARARAGKAAKEAEAARAILESLAKLTRPPSGK